MRNIFRFLSLLLILSGTCNVLAQKEGDKWLLGGTITDYDSLYYRSCILDFNKDPLNITITPRQLPFDFTNTLVCDSSGQLLCYSNGDNWYNQNYEIIENGDDFIKGGNQMEGYPVIQSYLILPLPGWNNTKLIYIYGEPKGVNSLPAYVKFRYATADMSINGGLGKVITRDIQVGVDTPTIGQITAVRNGNGRDWWVLVPRYDGDVFYRYLLSPNGLKPAGSQVQPVTTMGLGQAVFSPNGQWYARFNWHGIIPDSSFSTFDLYRFDRCSGLLSNPISKTYSLNGLDGKPGGIAFSNSSRFLYVSRWDSIFQYDLHAPDILASEAVVAVYDGFTADFGLPTRFFTLLLAPDNKIYCSVSNTNSRYLHVIENPDLPGVACNVQQHAIHLPVFNNNLLPNIPYYRLWEWENSPCDTLGSVAAPEIGDESFGMKVYPNPASDLVIIAFDQDVPSGSDVVLFNLAGQAVYRATLPENTRTWQLPLSNLPNSSYFIRAQTGTSSHLHKLNIIR